MQNKGAIWTFTILLTLACLFQISYSWVTNSVENDAEEFAQTQMDSIEGLGKTVIPYGKDTFNLTDSAEYENLKNIFIEEYLRKVAHEPAYPILGETYQECKERELSLGLDLKGGMAVTLEVSIPDLVNNLSGKSKNPEFRKAFDAAYDRYREGEGDFVDLFYEEFVSIDANAQLAAVFSKANKDKFPPKSTNDEVITILQQEKESALNNIEQTMNRRINRFGVSNATIQRQTGSGRIVIELPGVKDKTRVDKQLVSTAKLEFWECWHNYDAIPLLQKFDLTLAKAFESENMKIPAEDTSASAKPDDTNTVAVNTPLTKEDSLTKIKEDSLTAATKNAADTTQKSMEEIRKEHPLLSYLIFDLIGERKETGVVPNGTPVVGHVTISDTAKVSMMLNHPSLANVWPKQTNGSVALKLFWGAKTEVLEGKTSIFLPLYAIKVTHSDETAVLDGTYITDASQDYDQTGSVMVNMKMDSDGAEKWATITGANKDKHIAIVMDEFVYSAPKVQNQITGGSSVIEGNFTVEEAEDLASLLESGSLEAKARIVDSVLVGPSLGKANINSGLFSFVVALIVVLLYMYIYYNKAGLIANVALIANIFFLVGSLASIQASLTLPGIAGIVLTIGMAVDANVLIFERIREELRAGKGIRMAVNEGFSRALSSIIDGNLTTLLTAIVLAVFGSGPILGFATTLIIGIFTSLFSAIFISRLIIIEMLERKKDISFSTKITEKIFVNANYNFMGRRKLYYAFSALIVIGGIISLTQRGLDYGVEFTGGRTYEIKFEEAPDHDLLRKELAAVFVEEGQQLTPEIKTIENKYKAKITTKYLSKDESDQADSIVKANLEKGLTNAGFKTDSYIIESERSVDPVISNELIWGSIFAVAFSLVIIFLYILIRFSRWQFGLAAVLALFHDAMVVIGAFSLFYGILPFSMEIDQAFIAAVLTVVGYSINDTVVVFDRIREYMREQKRENTDIMINNALNSTLSRTINTSLTTLIVLVVIFIFGGEAIKGFSFALLVGIGIGTYSSLCVASPLVFDFAKKLTRNEDKK